MIGRIKILIGVLVLQIMLGGMLLPLLGYVLGAVIAWALGQPPADILAIAVETGIQNTGIAIFMLQFCLKQPAADLTTGNAADFLTCLDNSIKHDYLGFSFFYQ